MNLQLEINKNITKTTLAICGSKSESNRLLVLQKLFPEIEISNLSNAQDTLLLQKALTSKAPVVDVHHAGTAMRFLTAFFAFQEGREVILTGSKRMRERPIAILVDALKQMGATINYVDKSGFPPLKIYGKKLSGNKVTINSNVSSQYISALLLLAPKLNNGLEITLEKSVISFPYLKMTLDILKELGVYCEKIDNTIYVKPLDFQLKNKVFTIEPDWSSASYFYSIIALSPLDTSIVLSGFKSKSLQGDSKLAEIYKSFGVETKYNENTIEILKQKNPEINELTLDLKDTPDLAQTIAVTCFGLQLPCTLTGLQTLKIKETDRLQALKTELHKLGGICTISEDSFSLKKTSLKQTEKWSENTLISTYNDHRMAMAFAPLSILFPLKIEDAAVVEKSYPNFWEDLKAIGFKITSLK